MPNELSLVMAGDLNDGFQAIGPFESCDAASLWADNNISDVPTWIMTLIQPASHHLGFNVEYRDLAQAQVDCEETISELIFDRGENFQTDEGIDEEVCNELGQEILQRIIHELTVEEFVQLQKLIVPPDSIKL